MGVDNTPSAGLSPTLKLEKPLSAATADEIRAAAAAALRALPAGRSTVFFVESDESNGPEEGNDPDTPGDANSKPELAPTVAAPPASSPPASPTVVGNPLAGLLGGYSDDDTSESGADSPRVGLQQRNHPTEQKVQQQDVQQQQAPQQDEKLEQQQPALNSKQEQEQQQQLAQEDDPINAEVANFLQELETCGLLSDAEMTEAAAAQAVQQQQPGTVQFGSAEVHAHGPAADKAEAASDAASQAGTDAATAAAASPADDAGDAVADTDGPAEQRTLGYLAAAPEWCKVLDTGSGKPYYWNVNTNEVLWEPPEGIDGEALLPLEEVTADEVTTAAADAVAEPAAAAGDGSEQAGAAAADDLVAEPAPAEQHTGSNEAADQASSRLTTPPVANEAATLAPEGADTQVGAEQRQQQQSQQPAPQQDVQAVFLTLLSELQLPSAAQQLQQQLPEAVKLTLQLQLLHQQWQAFAAQQQAAADSEDPAAGFTWVNYELYIMQQLQQVVQRLQPAVQELERLGALSSSKRASKQQCDQLTQHQQGGQPETDQAAGKADSPAAAVNAGQKAAAAAAAGSSPKEDGEVEATTAAAEPDSSEEGEVAASEQESEDMDVDTDGSPSKAPPAAAASAKHGVTPKAAAAARAGPAGRYTAAGTYASTAHMPDWARPSYHYDFHAPHHFHGRGYGYDYDAYHLPYAAAEYAQHYGGAGFDGYGAGYDAAGYSRYGSAGYSMDGYGVAPAAAAAEGAAAEQPPLPEDIPPPLPDEPLPPGHPAAEQPPLPEDSAEATEAAITIGAAAASKQKTVVAQPAVRRAAAQAAPSELAGMAAASPAGAAAAVAATGSSSVEARKRPRDKDSKPAGAASKLKKTGKMSALINKWASVRQQQEAEELERQRRLEEAADPEVQEAKRLQQLEKWRLSQLESGAGENNPNFTPVAGDWRARLGLGGGDAAAADDADAGAASVAAGDADAQAAAEKAARKAARKAAKAAKAAVAAAAQAPVTSWPVNSKTKPDLVALSKGLPAGWQAMWDKDTGDIYYGNPTTKSLKPGASNSRTTAVAVARFAARRNKQAVAALAGANYPRRRGLGGFVLLY